MKNNFAQKASPSSAGPAFVAGATGYVGRHVVRALAARGVATVAHVRPDSPRLAEFRALFAADGAETDATPWDETALAATFRRLCPTMIFGLLGTTRARIKAAADERQVDYEAVDYGLTAMLIRAAKVAQIAPRFVYLSAVGVRSDAAPAEPQAGEKAEGNVAASLFSASGRSGYYLARWKVETELRASGLPFVVARPSFITGPDREENRPFEHVAAGSLNAVAGLAGALGFRSFRDRYLSLTGAQVAAALVALALEPGVVDGVFEADALRKWAQ
jgi:nucleoside-diphosphate-sugar epimerase